MAYPGIVDDYLGSTEAPQAGRCAVSDCSEADRSFWGRGSLTGSPEDLDFCANPGSLAV